MSSSSSRIEHAQERVRRSRYAIGIAAGVAFLGLGALVREAHPGRHQSATPSTGTPSASTAAVPNQSATFSQAESQGFFGGGSSISPSQSSGPATVQSSGS